MGTLEITLFHTLQVVAFTFIALFPVMNPLAGAMIFLNLTQGLPTPALNTLAKRVGINTFILLVIVLLTGAWILRFFGITIPIVQIGGGFVVTSLAWKVLNQPVTNSTDENVAVNHKTVDDMAFFPLTMPLTAGPGCIAVTLTVGAHETHANFLETLFGQAGAIIGIFLAAITVWICYQYADRITKKIGASGSSVIMRLSAFINLCIGLQIIWNGIQHLLTGIL